MGAFPSHDAPELIYTTLVQRPPTNSQVEVCMVPLLPRFFNDGHKKAKKKLNDLLASKGAPHSSLVVPPTPRGLGMTAAAAGKVSEQGIGPALVDHFISSTEGFFFVNTKDAVVSKVGEQGQRERADANATLGRTAQGSTPSGETQTHVAPPYATHYPSSHHAMTNTVRPVPFAVCIADGDAASTGSSSVGGTGQSAAAKHQQQAHSGNVVLIKGRRLQLVGFIACCMDRPVRHMTSVSPVKPYGSSACGGASLGDGKKHGTPLCLDVIFDDAEVHGFLTEPVVLLASFAFRKQFLNCCALHFPAGDPDVELAFERHMDSLQLRLVMRRDNYRILRMFHSRYPLLEMIEELRVGGCVSTPQFSLYETDGGEAGLEVTFGQTFLTRWMRYVESKVQVEAVLGNHVRCSTSVIMSDRDRLIQERRDSGAFLEEEEDDEQTFGGTLYARTLRLWIASEEQALQQQQKQIPLGGATPMYVYPTAAAAGQYWPHMSVMMGQPPAWPTGVVPLGAPATAGAAVAPMMGQQQPFFIQAPGSRTQLYYAPAQPTVAGNTAFVAPGGIPVVQQAPAGAPFGVAAPAGAGGQQVVYLMQGPQATAGTGAAATVSAVPAGIGPQTFYYPQQAAYAVQYPSYVLQQQMTAQAAHMVAQQQQVTPAGSGGQQQQ